MSPRRKNEPFPTVDDPLSDGAERIAMDALLKHLKYDPREIVPPLMAADGQTEAEADRLGQSLREFIPAAWKLVEPSTFVPNWHIDAIAEHLEAISKGDITDLLITMPPRHSKSLIVSVLWPVWEWINLPSYRWVFASYAFSLSVRDSTKRRKILNSPWYQLRFNNRFTMLDEQDTKIRYENNRHGFMLASSVGGSNTGEGGERIIADDPHNIKEAESEQVRNDTVDWWNIVMSTRRNEIVDRPGSALSARVVIQQRTHEGDVAGDIIERGGYIHLNLPTEFEFGGTARCSTVWRERSTGRKHRWEDPRQETGELLNPKRFDAAANEQAKLTLGDYQYAAQHGQNPTPPEGSIIRREWLKYYGGPDQPPVPDWSKCTHAFTPLFSLDCTFKEHKDTDYVAGLAWAVFGADIYLMPQAIHARMSFTRTIDAVAEFVGGTSLDGTTPYPGVYPFIKLKLVEDKANGSAVLDTLRHRIPGMIAFEPGGASKESRLISASWRFRAGNIYLPDESIAPWVVDYRYELCAFPKAKKDDYVDATSQALLFIGGDQQVTGEPIAANQESRWFHFATDTDAEDLGGGYSIWGEVHGSTRSPWRKY